MGAAAPIALYMPTSLGIGALTNSDAHCCFIMVRGNANMNLLPLPPSILDPSQTPRNVYYVHSSDGPLSGIVKLVLNHSNYHAWARSMHRALGSKNKFNFDDGSISIPIDLIRISKLGVVVVGVSHKDQYFCYLYRIIY